MPEPILAKMVGGPADDTYYDLNDGAPLDIKIDDDWYRAVFTDVEERFVLYAWAGDTQEASQAPPGQPDG